MITLTYCDSVCVCMYDYGKLPALRKNGGLLRRASHNDYVAENYLSKVLAPNIWHGQQTY